MSVQAAFFDPAQPTCASVQGFDSFVLRCGEATLHFASRAALVSWLNAAVVSANALPADAPAAEVAS